MRHVIVYIILLIDFFEIPKRARAWNNYRARNEKQEGWVGIITESHTPR